MILQRLQFWHGSIIICGRRQILMAMIALNDFIYSHCMELLQQATHVIIFQAEITQNQIHYCYWIGFLPSNIFFIFRNLKIQNVVLIESNRIFGFSNNYRKGIPKAEDSFSGDGLNYHFTNAQQSIRYISFQFLFALFILELHLICENAI